ncbi:MAG: Hsp20/alpha crystallin family protein [Candidatus Riflebacteria bacterium]|nr:Hsp20/alpha crystallin family protein [Candidatus Riflebacteria bacterium]
MAEKTIDNNQNVENSIAKREETREPESYITPVTDIYEEDKGLYMMVDLPGVDQDGLKLSVEEGVLTIEGHVKRSDNKEYLIREFEPSNYYRQFELSEAVDQEGINAELKNGVLNIFLPRAKAVQPRTIEVKFS